jgi:hypothetical protein
MSRHNPSISVPIPVLIHGLIVGLLLGLLAVPPAAAIDDAQYQAIRALGQLNGVALHCKYLEQTRRLKEALVATLPKRRALGDAFEQATEEAYLDFIQRQGSCPEAEAFAAQVDQGIARLQAVFPPGGGES